LYTHLSLFINFFKSATF